MSGNPVKIRDGSATVTGHKLPMPLVKYREGGSEVKEPEVRIPVRLCSSVPPPRDTSPQMRRMRPVARSGFVGFPSMPRRENFTFAFLRDLPEEGACVS